MANIGRAQITKYYYSKYFVAHWKYFSMLGNHARPLADLNLFHLHAVILKQLTFAKRNK